MCIKLLERHEVRVRECRGNFSHLFAFIEHTVSFRPHRALFRVKWKIVILEIVQNELVSFCGGLGSVGRNEQIGGLHERAIRNRVSCCVRRPRWNSCEAARRTWSSRRHATRHDAASRLLAFVRRPPRRCALTSRKHENDKRYLRWLIYMFAPNPPPLPRAVPCSGLVSLQSTGSLPSFVRFGSHAIAISRVPPPPPPSSNPLTPRRFFVIWMSDDWPTFRSV